MASERQVRVRLSLGVEFDNEATKVAFSSRLESVRSLLTPAGRRSVDNHGLLSALLDFVEGSAPPSLSGDSRSLVSHLLGSARVTPAIPPPSRSVVQSFNCNAGKSIIVRKL